MRYAFNTLTFIKRPGTTGIDCQQAEVLAEVLTEGLKDFTGSGLATQQDLKEFEFVLKQDIRDLEIDFDDEHQKPPDGYRTAPERH